MTESASVPGEVPTDSGWHKLAPMALVFLLLNSIQKFVRENLFIFAGAGFGVAVFDFLDAWKLLLLGLATLLFGLVSAMIFHRRFRFRIEDDAVRVRRGLFEKKELRVRFARVQTVQIGQPFYFKPFELVRFTLETPGGQESEVELPGIARHLAEDMRDRIVGLQNDQAPLIEPEDAEAFQEQQLDRDLSGIRLYHASTWRLFRHGLSSNQIWLLAGLAAWFFGTFSERIGEWAADNGWLSVLDPIAFEILLIGFLVLIVFALGSLLLLSGLLAIIRFHGYKLSYRGDRLVGVGGLLDQREQTVKREKITGLTVKQSALGRLLNCWHIVVRQTSSGDEEMPGQKKSFIVPGLDNGDLSLTHDIVPGWRFPASFQSVSSRLRRVFWMRVTALILLFQGISVVWGDLPLIGHVTPFVVLALILAGIHLRWRQWGWSLNGRLLWVQQGFFGRHQDVFDLDRVQQVQIRRSRYQRKHDLANLVLVLPQGLVTVPYLPIEEAAYLANQAIYSAETATLHRV
ncbi:MAG: PH domain-containing protein [Pseudomonadota bacterium]